MLRTQTELYMCVVCLFGEVVLSVVVELAAYQCLGDDVTESACETARCCWSEDATPQCSFRRGIGTNRRKNMQRELSLPLTDDGGNVRF